MMGCRDFERDLLTAIPDARSRAAVVAVLERWRGLSIYLPFRPKNSRRQQAAANMLENGMDSADITDALRLRFGISDRQARRDLAAAKASFVPNVQTICPPAPQKWELPQQSERTVT
jgi:hypothetical protein